MDAEPDLDELEWMAWQPMPDDGLQEGEEEQGFGEEMMMPDFVDAITEQAAEVVVPPRPCASHLVAPEGGQSTSNGFCRKRLLSDDSMHSLANETPTAAKRVRASDDVPSPSERLPDPLTASASSPEADLHNTTRTATGESPAGQQAFRLEEHLPSRMASSIVGDCIPITAPSGNRVYARLNQSGTSGTSKSPHCEVRTTKGLLAQPIELMFEQLDEKRMQKMMEGQTEDLPEQVPGILEGVNEQLWVDKYSPRSFTDLLSDEQTNRQVVRWLKQWDSFVFGHKTDPVTSREVLEALRVKQISTARGRGSYRTFKQESLRNKNFMAGSDGDFKNRSKSWTPKERTACKGLGSQAGNETFEKVLLLCGAPGLGKTTLAHVAAKHCGYRIVEINASDDRVAATLQAKILDAVQMKSVTGDCRPNCLIIDEIDGVVGGAEGRSAIKQLVDIITASPKNAASEESSSHGGPAKRSSKKAKANQCLARPIICICNDLYAPALRPLRQVARVHMFSRPSTSRVVTRLQHICNEEAFKANIRALTTLAEYAESDIRACLNTLQFLKRKSQPLTSADVGSQVIGAKDMTKTAYDIWGEIFRRIETSSKLRIPPTKQGIRDSKLPQDQLQFLRIYDMIANYGEHDLALNGVYENLMNCGYQDSSLFKTVDCLHAICDSDTRSSQVHSKQRFFLNAYQPSTLIAIRSLVALPQRPNIQWPKTFQRHVTELAGRREMLNTWMTRMSASISRSISATPLVLDMVSPLLGILSPPLRPVAVQLYTNSEKEAMKQVVDTMVSFGLAYKHDKLENPGGDDSESYKLGTGQVYLDPPFKIIISYQGHTVQYRPLPSTLCRIVGHEVELERIRRESLPAVKSDDSLARGPSSADVRSNGNTVNGSSINRVKQNWMFNMKSKKQESEVKEQISTAQEGILQQQKNTHVVVKDEGMSPAVEAKKTVTVIRQSASFFEGWKKKHTQGGSEKADMTALSNSRDSRPILYKFHEGFTNAIRRPMLVKEFF